MGEAFEVSTAVCSSVVSAAARITRLLIQETSGGLRMMRSHSARTSASRSSAGTSRFSTPHSAAVGPSRWPVKENSSARPRPASLVR